LNEGTSDDHHVLKACTSEHWLARFSECCMPL
jgi:hypothetical protein